MLTRLDLRGATDLASGSSQPPATTTTSPRRCATSSTTCARVATRALRELTERFDGWPRRRPARAREPRSTTRSRAPSRRFRPALEYAADRDPRLPRAPGPAARPRLDARRHRARGDHPPGRPRRPLRAGWPGRVPVDRADDRDSRRRSPACPRSCCACRPGPTAAVADADARGRRARSASTRCTGSAARRRSPRSRTAPRPSARSTSSSGPGTRTSPPPSARSRASSASTSLAGPSEVVVVADAQRARRVRRRRSRWRRPSTDRAAPPSSSRGTSTSPTRSTPRSSSWSATPARRHRSNAPSVVALIVDGPEQAMDVVNPIAPEHLELITDDAEALVPLVRNAGAVFVGPWAPAAVGDYVAGVNHVLPTARTARFASVLRVDTFRKHIHVVRVAPEAGLGAVAEHVEALATAEGLPAHGRSVALAHGRAGVRCERRRRCSGLDVPGAGRRPRDDLARLEGYHSPQLDVSVRLNTNESPYPPPAEFVDRWLAELRDAPLNRYPDRAATRAARRARARSSGSRRSGCSARTAPTRCCRRCCSPTAVRAPRARVRAHVRAARAHRPHHRHRRGGGRARAPTSRSTPTTRAALVAEHQPTIVFVCSPNNPTGHGRRPTTRSRRCSTRPTASSSSTRPTASSRRGARSTSSRDDGRLVVVRTYSKVWSMAALRLGFAVAPPWVVEQLEQVVLPYHLAVATQIAGRVALELGDEMRERVERLVAERERVDARRSARSTASPRSRRARTSCCSGRTATATRSGRRSSSAACSCVTARAGRASRTACASPSARPRRTTRSSHALRESVREVAA